MSTTLQSYLSTADAAALLAQLPSTECPAYRAASAGDQAAWLARASKEIDNAQKWQGRKYDLTQSLEFPRMAFEAAARVRNWGVMAQPVIPPGYGDVVWEWDPVALAPIVPQDVLLAVLYQADSLAAGTRAERLDEQHDGVSQTSAGGVSEQYRPGEGGRPNVLCRMAANLMRKYRVQQGRLM